MSNIATKLTYLNETKSKIKDSINLTGANITNEDTFRSYSDKLKQGLLDVLNNGNDYLYNNFPQLNDEGQNMSLTPTLEAPIKSELLGNTSQKTTTGKNLFDKNSVTAGYINTSGNVVYDETNSTSDFILIPNGATNLVRTTLKNSAFYDEDKVFISREYLKSLPVPNNAKYIRIQVNNNVLNNEQLEVGTVETEYEGYTNGASPNPDYPQEVINATGRQEVKVVGKNLFDYNDSTVTGYWGNAATKNNNGYLGGWGYFITFPIPLPAGTYTISFKVKDADNSTTANIVFQDINNQNIANSSVNVRANNSKTITSTENIKRIRVDNGKDAVTTLIYDIQIEQNNQATEYEVYKEQSYEIDLGNIELCKIGDYKDRIYKSTGKNLFDGSSVGADGEYLTNTGTVNTGTTNLQYTDYIKINTKENSLVISGMTETLSVPAICFYDENKDFISGTSLGGQTIKQVNIPINTKYFRCSYRITNTYTMIEYGTTPSSYEPYGKDKWYLEKNIGKVVLDGSESWTYYSVAQGSLFRSNNVILDEIKNNNYVPYSKYYQGISYNNYQNRQNNQFYINSDNNFLDFIDNRYTNANDFKTWLSTHNTIVYYILATPTTTEITEQNYPTLYSELNSLLNAKSYNGTTNIIITGETPANLKITVLKNE